VTNEFEMLGITKRFPGVLANNGIDLAVRTGEIHALMGENGAGKTTLMSILYGLLQPDAGEIVVRGRQVKFASPIDAIAHGLGMVHQSFKLFDTLSVWENVVFRAEPRHGLFIDRAAARSQVRALSERYGLAVDADAIVGRLPVGVRQRVEILKALYRDARILVLDEPTAVLTPQECQGLFAVMRNLVADGRTILFVTHKLREVMEVTDRVTVLRDGRVAARLVTRETSAEEITRAMTGRNVLFEPRRSRVGRGAPVLEVEELTVGQGPKPAVSAARFSVHGGEVVGIAGVAGNGQGELIEAIVGLIPHDAGRIRLAGRDVTDAPLRIRRLSGLSYIPEDRAITGTALAASAADNLGMGFHRRPPLASGLFQIVAALRAHARGLIARFAVKIPDEATKVGTLSGGNLQKIVAARELTHEAPVVIAEQPTRGLDVGATEFIHRTILEQRDAGRGVLLVSSELSEILSLCDRILVMYEGRIVAELDAGLADEAKLGLLMAGAAAAA
jgi:simple sugar transport system ATP-binding protein